MKYLLVVAVVVIGVWLWLRGRQEAIGDKPARPRRRGKEPVTMLACAHCGLNLPGSEAVKDAAGRPFCSEAHRLAGPS